MAGYDGRGTNFPLTIVDGADMAFQLTVVDSDSAAVDLSSATIAGEIYNAANTLLDTMTAAVSGAGNNIVTLSFTDTETAALTSPTSWTLWVTRGGDKRPWLAGRVSLVDGDRGQTSTSGSTTLTVDSNLTATVTVNAVGGVSSDAATISSGAGAPGSTPSKVGDIYIDTSTPAAYIATGTSSSADWAGILTAS